MIVLEQVSKTYPGNVRALLDIDLKVEKGEFVFVVGQSGSGKTTLFKLLLKEIEPTSGNIFINSKNIEALRRSQVPKYRRGVGVVFQDFRLLKDRNVYENIAFAQRIVGTPGRLVKKNVMSVLEMVDLREKYRSYPSELSGGEQQRVAMARALVNNPPILLADEPTGNLDPQNSWEIMRLLEAVNKRGTTVLVVTHNKDIVERMEKRVVTLSEGKIAGDHRKGGYIYV